MTSHAPAQPIEIDDLVSKQVDAIRDEGKRTTSRKLDLSDPRTINKEVVVALSRAVAPELVADKIKQLLEMTRVTKAGEVPDVRAMEAGIKLYLAYAVGLPTQRSEIVSVNVDADNALGLEERLRHSPALRAMFRKMLDNVEGGASDSSGPVVEG